MKTTVWQDVLLSVDIQFVRLGFAKIGVKAFFPGLLQLPHLSFPQIVQQFWNIFVDIKICVPQMFTGLIHHQFFIPIA